MNAAEVDAEMQANGQRFQGGLISFPDWSRRHRELCEQWYAAKRAERVARTTIYVGAEKPC